VIWARADVEKTKEVVEALPDAGKEAEQPELQPEREEPRPQPQQDQPKEQSVKVEQGVAMPPPNVQVVAPTNESPVPPQGSTPAVIDLTVDDLLPTRGSRRQTSRWSMPRIGLGLP
jgi:hypothetical protein